MDISSTDTDIASGVLGAPPNFGDLLIPHVMTFSGLTSGGISKTYRPSDEAIQHSWDNARFMRNDPAVMECIEARQRACALLNWHIEPEDQKNPAQKEAADKLKTLMEAIPYFTQYRENMLHAVWYGKYGIQNLWRKKLVRRQMQTVIGRWEPLHGDKLVFSWDKRGRIFDEDRIGVRVGWGYKAGQQLVGGFEVERVSNRAYKHDHVEPTEQGLAYFLTPAQRSLLTIHKHYIEDGEFENPEYAGRIHGVGVRSRIYWIWYQRQETLSWMMEYLERSGQGIDIFYFQAGNPESERRTRTAAQERVGTRNVILCPYFPDETGRPVYDHIEPSMAGASAMKEIVTELHGHLIKRYIMGQTLTSEQGSTGLGSNLADIHLGTFMQIVRYDATNLEERITDEVLRQYIRYNMPEWSNYDFRFRIDTESDDAKEKIESMETGYRMGLKIKAQEAYDTLGISKPAEDDEVLEDPQMAQAKMQMEQARQQGQAGAGGLPPGMTARIASDMAMKLLGAPVEPTSSPAGAPIEGTQVPADAGESQQAYSGTGNVASENSERVKIRTYSGEDGQPVETYDHAGEHQTALYWDAEREVYRKLKPMKGQINLFGDEDFDENEHPRAEDGKFTKKGTGSVRKKKEGDHGDKRDDDGERGGLLEAGGRGDFGLSKDDSSDDLGKPSAKRGSRSAPKPPGSGRVGGLPESDGPRSADGGRDLFGGWDEPSGSPTSSDQGNASSGDGGSGGTGRSGTGSDGSGPTRSVPPRVRKPPKKQGVGNYRYPADFKATGQITGFNNNVAALKVLRDMRNEERGPTEEERQTLSKFIGWGQYSKALDHRTWEPEWVNRRKLLKDLMEPAEFEERVASASKATLNSHFTEPAVVRAHWKINEKLGFKGGRMLEPSAGTGYYLGMMPESVADKTAVTAIELDQTTGDVLKALNPGSDVKIQGFEKANTPDNFYDLVSSNVPFGGYGVHDPKYNKHQANIHDYFFLKSVDAAKPGGLITHVTSAGTMDKPDSSIRKALEDKAEFVAAIRFPGNTHKGAGTQVVTDLVILRKRMPGQETPPLDHTPHDAEPKRQGFTGTTTDSLGRLYHWVNGVRVPGDRWLGTTTVPDPAGGEPIPVNQYFADNPQMMLGTLDRTGTMYQGESMNVSKTDDYDQRLAAAIEDIPENVTGHSTGTIADAPEILAADDDVKNGAYVEKDGKYFQRHGGQMEEVKIKEDDVERIRGQMEIRDAMRALIDAERNRKEGTSELRSKLNEAYDGYVEKYGYLHEKANLKAFDGDPDQVVIASLEKWNSTTKTAKKSDLFEKNTITPDLDHDHADDVPQGVAICLMDSAKIDPDRIAKLTGKDIEDVHYELTEQGLAYEDPAEGWQMAAQYLSGNIRQKLKIAEAAAAVDERYTLNVEALKEVLPPDLTHVEIGIRLGVPWLPPSDAAAFAAHLCNSTDTSQFEVDYDRINAHWTAKFANNARLANSDSANEIWSTPQTKFGQVLTAALNNRPITIRSDKDDEGRTYVMQAETDAANAKVQEMRKEFKEWVWTDDERRERLTSLYNETMNDTVPMVFDGSHQVFPGRTGFDLRPLQKNFVWQVVTTGTGCAGHEVGTGKTASMLVAAMELRRLKLAKKPAILCLKSNIEQMTAEAQSQYPGAKILSLATAKDASQRKELISQIATGDYDMIFMTHDHFNLLPVKGETEAEYIREEMQELEASRYAVENGDMEEKQRKRTLKQMEKAKAKLLERLQKSLKPEGKDDALTFEELGIDQIFVDEAHKFKSLQVHTAQGQIKGVPTNSSQRATHMQMITRYIQSKNNGRGVVFATGTPVANTMAELYNIQRYLHPNELKARGLEHFDAWAATFGEMETKMEWKLTGNYEPVTRFSSFTNVPELMAIANQVMDVQRVENMRNPDGSMIIKRPDREDIIEASPDNEHMSSLMKDIAARARALKGKKPEKGEENTISLLGKARMAAVDPRLVDASAPDLPGSKINRLVGNVIRLSRANPGQTQLIFSDIGVNDNKDTGFSVYEDIKKKLLKSESNPDGLEANQIADFSQLEGAKKQEAQSKLRRGEILVAIGSSQKLGTGVNVQAQLQAIHHLDVPYVPADIEQRDGRGWRSGNRNATGKIAIHRYVQKGSVDALNWQIIARKAKFIKEIMNSKKPKRNVREEDSDDLSPELLMAAAAGDQRLVDKIDLEYDLSQLREDKKRHEQTQAKLNLTRDSAKRKLDGLKDLHKNTNKDVKHLESNKDFVLDLHGDRYDERAKAVEALTRTSASVDSNAEKVNTYYRKPVLVGTYRGMELWRKPGAGFVLKGVSGREYETGDSLQSVEAVARLIPKKLENNLEQQKQVQADIDQTQSRSGKKWDQDAALKEMEDRLAALELDIKTNPDAKRDMDDARTDYARSGEVYRPDIAQLSDAFSKAFYSAIGGARETYAKDAAGHEHKGTGPGGGQFTSTGGGGGSTATSNQQSQRQPTPQRQPTASPMGPRPQVVPKGRLTNRQQRQMPMVATHNQLPGTDGMLQRQTLAQKTQTLSAPAKQALHAYTYHENAFPLNTALREDPTGKTLPPTSRALYQQLQSALKEANGLKEPVSAFRGVDSRFSEKAIADAQAALSGSRIIEGHGISSLSINPKKSVDYAKGSSGVLYRIAAKSGAYVEPLTRAKGEEELVHGHGKRYYVHGIKEEDHVDSEGKSHRMRVIHIEELV